MADNANGNVKNWLMVIGILVSLLMGVLSFARDTPTRQEMQTADQQMKQDVSHQLDGMEVRLTKRLDRIENKVDDKR